MQTELVSAIIINWNRKDEIKKCLESLFKQDYKNMGIIVIDNGSSDGSLGMLKDYGNKIRLIENKKNIGACKARNMGLAYCNGSLVFFMDSDAELFEGNTVSKMVNLMMKDKELGGIGAVVFSNLKERRFFTSASYLAWNGFLDKKRSLLEIKEPRYDIDYVSSCVSMFRKEALLEAGGFDEYYFYGEEDNDIGMRLKKLGWKLVVDPNIVAIHNESQKGRRKIKRLHPRIIHMKSYFIIKNYPLKDIIKYYIFSYGILFRELLNVLVKNLTLFLIPYILYKKKKKYIEKFIRLKR